MPTKMNGKVYFSFTEISCCTGRSLEEVQERVTELAFPVLSSGYQKYILRDSLPRFFELFYGTDAYKLTYRLPSYLKSSPEPWCATLRDMYADPVTRPASLSPQQGEFLRSLVTNTNPETVVEIGTFLGVSTIWIAGALQDAARDGKLFSIDLNCDILPLAKGTRTKCILNPLQSVAENIEKAGLSEHIILIQGNSRDIGAKWTQFHNAGIDVLYIDGDHTIEGTMADYLSFSKYLKPGGIVILHDIFPENCSCEGPRVLIDRLSGKCQFPLFELETSPHNFGMAVFRAGQKLKPRRKVLE